MPLNVTIKPCSYIIFTTLIVLAVLRSRIGLASISTKAVSRLQSSGLLLGGVELDQDNNIVLLDEEMASMRQGRAFLSLINDNVPRSLSSMEQMADALEGQRSRPMMERQFENVVLSMVYTAHQAWHEKRKERQEAWGEVLLNLEFWTKRWVRGPQNSVRSKGLWGKTSSLR
uniref:Family with sequence similarity 180 member B n=1 Tax=Haplochromis burtoni TaxID=8153 RepID=A0A3Q2WYH9_HAPBU